MSFGHRTTSPFGVDNPTRDRAYERILDTDDEVVYPRPNIDSGQRTISSATYDSEGVYGQQTARGQTSGVHAPRPQEFRGVPRQPLDPRALTPHPAYNPGIHTPWANTPEMQAINSEAYGRSTRPPSRLERATPGRSGHERGGLDMYQPSSRPPSRAQASQEDNIPYPNYRHRVGESRLRRPTVDEEERKHKCLRCGDSFRRKQHLEDHEERHLNRKQYQCDVVGCLECFNTKGDVRSHIKNKHGIHS